MQTMFKKLLLCSLFVGFFWGNAVCEEKLTLTYFDFPPYEYQEDKAPHGIFITIVKDIFNKANISLELEFLPFKRGYNMVKKGKIDGIFNFYKVKERLEYFDYSEPIIKNPLHFFSRKDSAVDFNTLDDLKNLKIGLLRGYTYGEEFDNSTIFKKDITDSHIANFKKLAFGRIDLYPCDKLVGIYLAKKNNLMSELEILPTPLKVMDGYIGFTKGRHQKIIDTINTIVIKMHQNGDIEKIINNYIEKN